MHRLLEKKDAARGRDDFLRASRVPRRKLGPRRAVVGVGAGCGIREWSAATANHWATEGSVRTIIVAPLFSRNGSTMVKNSTPMQRSAGNLRAVP